MRINEQIRIPQVRLFDDTTDEALGIVPVEQARQLAVERGLDLVEVAATAQPPVCRLMDYGRFKFEALKREKDSRRDHNVVQLKEQKLRPKISDHDFMTKLAKVKQFLGEGDKVKLTIMFRGREMVHQEYGRKLLDRMTTELRDLAVIDRSPLVEGRNMIMILSPTVKKQARGDHGHEHAHGEKPHGREEHTDGNGNGSGAEHGAPAPAPVTPVEVAVPTATAAPAEAPAAAPPPKAAARRPVAPKTTTTAAADTAGGETPARKPPVRRRGDDAKDPNA